MLTQRCAGHLLPSRSRDSELDLPSDPQVERTVVPLVVSEFKRWHTRTDGNAAALVRLWPVKIYRVAPAWDFPSPPGSTGSIVRFAVIPLTCMAVHTFVALWRSATRASCASTSQQT